MSSHSVLAAANQQWFSEICQLSPSIAIYWRSETFSFRACERGNTIFFYDRTMKNIVGRALYSGECFLRSAEDLWDEYREATGAQSLKALLSCIDKTLGSSDQVSAFKNSQKRKLCCIKVINIEKFISPVKYEYYGQQPIKIFNDHVEDSCVLFDLSSAQVKINETL